MKAKNKKTGEIIKFKEIPDGSVKITRQMTNDEKKAKGFSKFESRITQEFLFGNDFKAKFEVIVGQD